MTPKQMLEKHEEEYEAGGFFIINGNEKLVRMLIVPRSNYVINFLFFFNVAIRFSH